MLAWMSSILAGLLTPITLIFASVPVVGVVPILGRPLAEAVWKRCQATIV